MNKDDSNPPTAKTAQKPRAYTIKYKRPRGSRACTVCRARKVRCDAEAHYPCTNCITFGCECLLPEVKRKPAFNENTTQKTTHKESRNPEAENESKHPDSKFSVPVGQNQSPDSPKDKKFPHCHDHSTHAPGISTPCLTAPISDPVYNISQVSVPPSLTSKFKHGSSPKTRQTMPESEKSSVTFVGHSSISLMAQKVGQNHVELGQDLFEEPRNPHLDSIELEILRLRGAFLLPSKELATDLVHSYFEHVHPLMPAINRTEFMAKFNDPNDSPSLMLLQAVLLCGCRVSKNPLLFDSNNSSDLASSTFFRRAKALYETNFETDPVTIVQTILLMGTFWESPKDVTRNSYYWTKVGVGLAHGYGFHRDISTSSTISASEKRTWRRLWWCLFEKDRNVAIAFGRPTSIDLADSDAPMLTLDDFNEDDPERGIVSPYPVNETHALYFIHLVKLAEITGIIISNQYTVKAESMKRLSKFSITQRCDMLMGIWFNNLPPQLQFSLTDLSKQNFYACLLNAQYYNRLYLIHRANLLRMARSSSTNPNNYKYPSWGISFQAARMISIVSKILLDKGLLKYCPMMFIYVLFSSLMMLIYHVDSSNPVIASTASDSLFISKSVLKEMGKYWRIVGFLLKLYDKYANDKIKRAQVIERGTLIAEMQDNKSTHGFDPVRSSTSGPMISPNHTVTPVPPPTNGYQNTDPVNHSQDFSAPNPDVTPDFEQFIRQHKNNLNGNENGNTEPMPSTNSNIDNTPQSNNSFPEIPLVTEKQGPEPQFLENFEPTQLFPTVFSSYPASRVQSPFIGSGGVKSENGFTGMPAPIPQNNFSSSEPNLPSNESFTNFIDSAYINMNLQSHVEDERSLNDELGLLFNMC